MTRLARDVRGTAAVEFALVAPLLFLVLLGIMDASRSLAAYVSLRSAADDGVRYLAGDPGRDSAAVIAEVQRRAVLVDSGALTVDVAYHDGTAWRAWAPWPARMTDPAVATVPIRVETRYPWTATSIVLSRFVTASELVTRSVAEGKP